MSLVFVAQLQTNVKYPEIDPHKYSQLVFTKEQKQYKGKSLSIKWFSTKTLTPFPPTNTHLDRIPLTKLHSK